MKLKLSPLKINIKTITALEAYPVRHPVLRAGQDLASCKMEADNLPDTYHYGVYLANKLAGVATFMADVNAHFEGKQYRLRGMAVLPEQRTLGLGRALITHGESLLKKLDVEILWFNARVAAVPFYKKMGFTVIGTPFEIDPIGTHYLMYKKLK